MPDLLIRGLSEQTIRRLRDRARRNGRSLQSEAKRVLENVAGPSLAEIVETGRQLRKQLGRTFSDSADLIREDRDQ